MKLTNAEIFNAWDGLSKLMVEKFPVKTSMGLVKLRTSLDIPYKEINTVKDALIEKHGEKQENGKIGLIAPNTTDKETSKNWDVFVAEFNELMEQETDISFEVVHLPEKVSATCDKCHHNMERLLEIEPTILLVLNKFVEV